MAYSEENINKIIEKYHQIPSIHRNLLLMIGALNSNLTNKNAAEFLMQGVGRRLKILTRCIHNIFKIFPVEKNILLGKNELADVDINLHAFFININGILDNLAWVFIHENALLRNPKDGKINKHGVGLFKKETNMHFRTDLKKYLESDRIKDWYFDYSQNYRDALAHRIPLYVPPSALNEKDKKEYLELDNQLWDFSSVDSISHYNEILERQNQIGRACPLFSHSFSEGSQPVYLHAQIIADYLTVEEIITRYCEYFK